MSLNTHGDAMGKAQLTQLSHQHDEQHKHHCLSKSHCLGDYCGQIVLMMNVEHFPVTPQLNSYSLKLFREHPQPVLEEHLRPPIRLS